MKNQAIDWKFFFTWYLGFCAVIMAIGAIPGYLLTAKFGGKGLDLFIGAWLGANVSYITAWILAIIFPVEDET